MVSRFRERFDFSGEGNKMAFIKLQASYSSSGIVGRDGKGGFVETDSFDREPVTYSDYKNEPTVVTKDDLRKMLLTKEDLYKMANDPDAEYKSRILAPKEGDLAYDHITVDLSSYATKEDQQLAHQVIGDALRNPDFDYSYNKGKNAVNEPRPVVVPLHGKRAVVDMGIHRNTGYPHAQFLVMVHSVNDDKTISASASFRKREFSGQQIEEINRKLEQRGLARLEPTIQENPDMRRPQEASKSGSRARRPEQDTVEATNALIETASVDENESSVEETKAILEETFEERDRQANVGMDEDQLRKIQIDRELNGTRALLEQRIEEINRLRSNAKALELARSTIEENQQLRGDLKLAEQDINKLKTIASIQQQTITDFKEAKEQLEATIEQERADSHQAIQVLREEVLETKESLEKTSKEFDDLSVEHDELKKSLDSQTAKMQQMELDFKAKEEDLTAKIDDLTSGKQILLADKEELTSKLSASEQKSAQLEARVKTLLEEVDKERQAKVTAESKVEALENSFRTFQERSDQQFAAMQARFDDQLRRLEESQAKQITELKAEQKRDLDSKLSAAEQVSQQRVDKRNAELEAAAREATREIAKTNPEKAQELERRFSIERTRDTQELSKDDKTLRSNAEERRERKLRERADKKKEEGSRVDQDSSEQKAKKGDDSEGDGPDDDNTPNKKRRR